MIISERGSNEPVELGYDFTPDSICTKLSKIYHHHLNRVVHTTELQYI